MDNRDLSKAVCKCKKVFFEDIDDAIKKGASTFEDVQTETKLSTGCGRCMKYAKEITTHLLSRK